MGAGPGDPGLLTLRGAEVLAGADVVIYDRLSVASLLDLAPTSAERISVGKAPGHQGAPQEYINSLLVERGRAGLEVVRLKGGDPFVFARGGEEAAALADAGVAFEVVPGVTSAVAAPAYAGVPITQRGRATSFTVVTGHEDPWAATETDWEAVAQVGGTIVVLMGVATRAAIADRLIGAGLAPDTPVVAVRWGTRPDQRTVRTTLDALGAAELKSPATIVIGSVAALDLRWFEDRPLLGRRVVVSRAREQASELSALLRRAGAEAIEVPAIRIADASDGGAGLRAAAARAQGGAYAWIVFTSANSVGRFFAGLRDARDLGGTRVAAIGPATASVLRGFGVEADLIPARFVSETLLSEFPAARSGGRVLLPRAAVARDVLPEGLVGLGWDVDVVEAYRTQSVPLDAATVERIAAADAVTFTSSSTVQSLVDALGGPGSAKVPRVVACIGPITSA
ncbi:MAG: uroporphyrinogen-III C-methyltransferase, partial [Acidimicrobiales bacterium]